MTQLAPEEHYRAAAASLLAALLRAPPDQDMLLRLTQLGDDVTDPEDALGLAMQSLARAAAAADVNALADEYHHLFIGVGRGELMPYASWYLTGFLHEQPLSDLRDELAELGFERAEAVAEPEDHLAAIFEVFSVMIFDQYEFDRQQGFFERHIAAWVERFWGDLEQASSAQFYRAVAKFGRALFKLESQYFSMIC